MRRTQRMKQLEESGYCFSGVYFNDNKEAAKEKAMEFRKNGLLATVVSREYMGKVTGGTGYSVYIKEKKNQAKI